MVPWFESPCASKLTVEVPRPHVRVSGGGTFGRCLDYEGGAPPEPDQCYSKRPHRAPWLLPPSEDVKVYTPKRALTQPYWHPDLRYTDSRSVRNQLLLFISHAVCGIV